MVSAGSRNILAGGLSSLDEAIGYVTDSPGLLEAVDREQNSYNEFGGMFVPGEMAVVPADIGLGRNIDGPGSGTYPINWSGYEFGLQTVGQEKNVSPVFFDTPHPLVGPGLDLINGDGFLAYAVQVEEDIVNRKILEMHQQTLEKQKIQNDINTAKGFLEIRERDAWLTRQSDAQAGRVLKDHKGNWVRVQQYVLRPDNKTVQILSASLRDVAGKSELSTLDFTTVLRNSYSLGNDLRDLPWNTWLDTQVEMHGDAAFKYVLTGPEDPLLEKMSVTIKNPSEQRFQETRIFAEKAIGEGNSLADNAIKLRCVVQEPKTKQYITDESLDVSGAGLFENHFYFNNQGSPESADVHYLVDPGQKGFAYRPTDGSDPIKVDLYNLVDNGVSQREDKDKIAYKDIWDALRVNEEGARNIGASSLEMVITDGAKTPRFNEFDVVYIPMSRMLWKDKAVDLGTEPAT